ncbi:MAG: hypothetical protein J2P41_03360 [Blastocatellia bacterium]|nr:hypothetical protein [Blastocatellia bacterium]
MANMGSYCKAYPIERFREFDGWSEKIPISADREPEDGLYLFLQENLVVTDGIFIDEKVVFDRVTPEWEAFCKDKLGFEIPDFCSQVNEESAEAVAISGGAQ